MIMDGKAVADRLLTATGNYIRDKGIRPVLAVVTVGEDPASKVYVRNKMRACERVGIECRRIRLAGDAATSALETVLCGLSTDSTVHGIIVQLPLPPQIDQRVLNYIVPDKDVDGLGAVSMLGLYTAKPGHLPCTPKGIIRLLHEYMVPIAGSDVCIIGRSNLVGRPLARLLEKHNATVTLCHSHTVNLKAHAKQADIIVAAAGAPNLITVDMIKPRAVVIDVGINRAGGKLIGDCAPDVAEAAALATPVPGGVGPMTVAELMDNTLRAYWRCAGEKGRTYG